MAPVLTYQMETLAEGYKAVCDLILAYGEEASPRGQKTKELLNPTIVLHNPACALPVGINRGADPKVGAVEALQLCGGFSDPDLTALLSPYYAALREPYTNRYHGAYGARIGVQARSVINKLEIDPDSRQAVIVLWDAYLDNLFGKLDYPCTVSLQFYIRDGRLHCTTNMRSNDAWLGLAYDLFQFGQLQWTIANELKIDAGDLTHRPVSLHLYERDWEKVDRLAVGSTDAPWVYGFQSLGRAEHLVRTRHLAGTVPTQSEEWYVTQLAPLFAKLEERDG